MAGGDEPCENSSPLQSSTFDDTTWIRKIYTQNRTENWCHPDCRRIKILGANLATYQLATGAENNMRTPNKNENEMRMEWEAKWK